MHLSAHFYCPSTSSTVSVLFIRASCLTKWGSWCFWHFGTYSDNLWCKNKAYCYMLFYNLPMLLLASLYASWLHLVIYIQYDKGHWDASLHLFCSSVETIIWSISSLIIPIRNFHIEKLVKLVANSVMHCWFPVRKAFQNLIHSSYINFLQFVFVSFL